VFGEPYGKGDEAQQTEQQVGTAEPKPDAKTDATIDIKGVDDYLSWLWRESSSKK